MPDAGGLPELDPIVHGQLRLALLSLLAGDEEADFKWLREKTGSTDGNLGANLAKLEEVKYIGVTKKFVANKLRLVHSRTATRVCISISVGYEVGMKSSSADFRSSRSIAASFSSTD